MATPQAGCTRHVTVSNDQLPSALPSPPPQRPLPQRQLLREHSPRLCRPSPQPLLTADVVEWIKRKKNARAEAEAETRAFVSKIGERKKPGEDAPESRCSIITEEEEDRIWSRFPGPLCPALFPRFGDDAVGRQTGVSARRRNDSQGKSDAGSRRRRFATPIESVRGVMATRQIHAGSLLIKLPKEALITTETILKESEVGSIIARYFDGDRAAKKSKKTPTASNDATITCPSASSALAVSRATSSSAPAAATHFATTPRGDGRLTATAAFCAFLIFESQRPNSLWAPYLKTLPKEFALPAFLSVDEFGHFPVSLRESLKKEQKKIREIYEQLRRLEEAWRRRAGDGAAEKDFHAGRGSDGRLVPANQNRVNEPNSSNETPINKPPKYKSQAGNDGDDVVDDDDDDDGHDGDVLLKKPKVEEKRGKMKFRPDERVTHESATKCKDGRRQRCVTQRRRRLFTWRKVLWSYAAVSTRSIFYEDNHSRANNILRPSWGAPVSNHAGSSSSPVASMALAPFLDMLNHLPSAKVETCLNEATASFEIRTYDCYRPGDQVFINYGSHGDATLCLLYGFLTSSSSSSSLSPHDSIAFSLEDVLQCRKSLVSLSSSSSLSSSRSTSPSSRPSLLSSSLERDLLSRLPVLTKWNLTLGLGVDRGGAGERGVIQAVVEEEGGISDDGARGRVSEQTDGMEANEKRRDQKGSCQAEEIERKERKMEDGRNGRSGGEFTWSARHLFLALSLNYEDFQRWDQRGGPYGVEMDTGGGDGEGGGRRRTKGRRKGKEIDRDYGKNFFIDYGSRVMALAEAVVRKILGNEKLGEAKRRVANEMARMEEEEEVVEAADADEDEAAIRKKTDKLRKREERGILTGKKGMYEETSKDDASATQIQTIGDIKGRDESDRRNGNTQRHNRRVNVEDNDNHDGDDGEGLCSGDDDNPEDNNDNIGGSDNLANKDRNGDGGSEDGSTGINNGNGSNDRSSIDGNGNDKNCGNRGNGYSYSCSNGSGYYYCINSGENQNDNINIDNNNHQNSKNDDDDNHNGSAVNVTSDTVGEDSVAAKDESASEGGLEMAAAAAAATTKGVEALKEKAFSTSRRSAREKKKLRDKRGDKKREENAHEGTASVEMRKEKWQVEVGRDGKEEEEEEEEEMGESEMVRSDSGRIKKEKREDRRHGYCLSEEEDEQEEEKEEGEDEGGYGETEGEINVGGCGRKEEAEDDDDDEEEEEEEDKGAGWVWRSYLSKGAKAHCRKMGLQLQLLEIDMMEGALAHLAKQCGIPE